MPESSDGKTIVYYSGDLQETCEPEDLLPAGARVMLSFWKSWSFSSMTFRPSQRLRKLLTSLTKEN